MLGQILDNLLPGIMVGYYGGQGALALTLYRPTPEDPHRTRVLVYAWTLIGVMAAWLGWKAAQIVAAWT